MAVRTRILMRLRSPLLMPPKTDMTRSWASLSGSIGPPISGTHKGTLKWVNRGKVLPNWLP
ncbi:hypothetical protein Z951_46845 [Streptomyces sp. PRh5]|nr:hypothetical protein Z951_46845 [Streptomyces sp. PRh5]